MIFWLFAPFQDGETALVISGVGIVMGESVANVGDVFLGLALVEVSSKHMFKVFKVFTLDLALVRPFHYGVHQVSGQLKVPEHVAAL